jgi:hypothetical protein
MEIEVLGFDSDKSTMDRIQSVSFRLAFSARKWGSSVPHQGAARVREVCQTSWKLAPHLTCPLLLIVISHSPLVSFSTWGDCTVRD